MAIQQGYYNRVKYTLYHKTLGSQIIEEPEGWKDDGKEFSRHSVYHGIFPQFSNVAKYSGDAYEFLKLAFELESVLAKVRLVKEEKDPKTDLWVKKYAGFFDFSTYVEEDKKISLKFNSDGLIEELTARESEEVEIERTTDLFGKSLPNIATKEIYLDGRKIFLKSEWECKTDSNIPLKWPSSSSTNYPQYRTVPLSLIVKSHEEAQSIIDIDILGTNPLDSGDMFFLDSESAETRTLNLNINLSIQCKFYYYAQPVEWDKVYLKIRLIKYSNGTVFDNPTTIFDETIINAWDNINNSWSNVHILPNAVIYQKLHSVDLNKSDSLSLQFYIDYQGTPVPQHDKIVDILNLGGSMKVEEDSYYPGSKTKAIMAHELYDRVVTIITGRHNAVKSKALGRTDIGYFEDGKDTGAFTGLAHGMWIRGFDKNPQNEDNKYKPFKTSFRDLHESFAAVWGLGVGVEKKGNIEWLRVEHLSYFYNRNVIIKLGKVGKVRRSVATDYYFSGLQIGYDKGGDYEEAQGLDEYNTKSNYISCITRFKNTKTLLSKYRADMYGAEFTRRKPKSTHVDVDTSADQDVWMFDTKRQTYSLFNLRKWQDDMEQIPIGVYDPNSAANLRLSPTNNLMRNSWFLNAGLVKFPTEYLRFGSSTGNSKLKTKLIGKPLIGENEDIQNNILSRPKFEPIILEFEYKVNHELYEKLMGHTVVMGEEIMNIYGCFEIINESNEVEKGFLLSVKTNGNGQWKLLKVY